MFKLKGHISSVSLQGKGQWLQTIIVLPLLLGGWYERYLLGT